MRQSADMKIAVVYEKATTWGGAERLLLQIARLFPQAVLYVSIYRPQARWAHQFAQLHTSVWQNWPGLNRLPAEWWLMLDWHMFTRFDFSAYDLVLSVSSYQAKYLITNPGTWHVNYCLSPTRYLWSERARFPVQQWWADRRVSDQYSAQLPDKMLTLSALVQRRIRRYYGRQAEVIYPGVELSEFQYCSQKQNYLLLVSRLVQYKRVDLAIQACIRLNVPLRIVGTGPLMARLQQQADGREHIEFLGAVSQTELAQLYARAQGVIMPQIEDFGLVALEAWASGTPVVLHKFSGVSELDPGQKASIQFTRQESEAITEAIAKLKAKSWDYRAIRQLAQQYTWDKFGQKLQQALWDND